MAKVYALIHGHVCTHPSICHLAIRMMEETLVREYKCERGTVYTKDFHICESK